MASCKPWAFFFLSAVLVVTASLPLHGQSTYGSITGAVLDSSGAAIVDAKVTLTNVGTAEKHTQSSGSDGSFSFVNLFPGRYRIDAEKPGFKHFVQQVTVEVQQSARIEATLQVGEVSQTVEVTSETPLLQVETSSLGQVVEQRKADELPLNGRNIFNLITISPAAVAQGGSGGSPVTQNPFSWGNYQIGGSFANQGAQYLDGQPLNIGYINLPIIIPTQDSIGEYKVQYNNLGAEWGKFSGGIVNLSTKSGTNSWHGSAYEFFRNKVLNANEYFHKRTQLQANPVQKNEPPPWSQNQYGIQLGGPVIKNKTFFYVSWEQYRQRTGSPFTTTVPGNGMLNGDFSALCTAAGGTFDTSGLCSAAAGQVYDPFMGRTPYGKDAGNPNCPGNCIPAAEFSKAATTMWNQYFPAPTDTTKLLDNFASAAASGGNTNEFVVRGDQNIGSNTRLFGRYAYFGLTDLPKDPLGTGLCFDRCAELYHSKLLAVGINHTFTPTTILDVNLAGSRFVYARAPILSGFDLTTLGWPDTYNSPAGSMRTPPTPAFPFNNDVGKSQGNSAIGDHNTQYNLTPALTMIRGKHTIQVGGQVEIGLDNYFQTNIASGAFAFGGSWTTSAPGSTNANFAFADFLLGLSQNQGQFVNQTEGVAQVPAQTAGKQVYRAFYGNDTWRLTSKLTLNLGLRYELQGTWSERFNRFTYWDPTATNATVTGCGGTAGSPCLGDAFLVKTGRNSSPNNIPMDKKAFSPRFGFAYALNQKTVIRGGYGIFFIPNYVSFGLNPDNDPVNLASTPFTATKDGFVTPFSTLDGFNCTLTGTATAPVCAEPGPFGAAGIILPPGRNPQPNLSAFIAANGSPNLAPYFNPKFGYVEQYNINLQRQLPAGFFVDVAYAGSHGVHLEQYNTNINQIPDSFVAQAASQFNPDPGCILPACNPNANVTIAQTVANPMAGTSANPTIGAATITAGQLDRPYPQYLGLNLQGYGCCSSTYNSLQATVQRRFQGGGTLLVAYTNAKLLTNTDTLTSWLENGSTGGVGQVQDWNNLKGEKSLSSQDVSQRLVISYVLDLPFGHGKRFASGLSGAVDKLVSGWGINGVITFQRGFPLKIGYAGSTFLGQANLGVANIRPNVVAGCSKTGPRTITEWFNTACFAAPPAWGFGTESRVDPTLRAAGINNFDFAFVKKTSLTERMRIEFLTEFFNLFNHPQFGFPSQNLGSGDFGTISSTVPTTNPRLIQFALKLVF
ncbi:MAG: TonB-dependent receptor [Acidobacteriia bacterium]|nr:TonB-dependent receptor [Terriglobia bacterium]